LNAARLLETARAAGLPLLIDGENLILEADWGRELPTELIAELRERKAELMVVLSGCDPELSPDTTEAAPSPEPRQRHVSRSDPVRLRDGRRLCRFQAHSIPDAAPDRIAVLMGEARRCGVVLVPDGRELIVVEPRSSRLPEKTLQDLKKKAGGVIAALRGESDARLAHVTHGGADQHSQNHDPLSRNPLGGAPEESAP
jgi:hypothetical protein